MSLPAGQQRMLDGIEDGLRAHDGRLASLFATFTRLTGQEQMPELEQFKPKSRAAAVRGKWRAVRAGEQRPNRLGERTGGQGGLRWVAFVPVALVAVVSVLIIGLLGFSNHKGQCASGMVSDGSSWPPVSRSGSCSVRHAPAGRGGAQEPSRGRTVMASTPGASRS
jgi:hypothetical protein